jgi:hypothetical protein
VLVPASGFLLAAARAAPTPGRLTCAGRSQFASGGLVEVERGAERSSRSPDPVGYAPRVETPCKLKRSGLQWQATDVWAPQRLLAPRAAGGPPRGNRNALKHGAQSAARPEKTHHRPYPNSPRDARGDQIGHHAAWGSSDATVQCGQTLSLTKPLRTAQPRRRRRLGEGNSINLGRPALPCSFRSRRV